VDRKTMVRYSLVITRHSLLIAVLLACAGCSSLVVSAGNYLTYDYAFNDAEAEKARQNAKQLCAARRQMAIETRNVCTLSRCVTDFQCVDPKDPLKYQPPGLMDKQY
jgi:hypothetical protein